MKQSIEPGVFKTIDNYFNDMTEIVKKFEINSLAYKSLQIVY